MSFPSTVPGIATKFVTANFAADLAANDLILMSALLCVSDKDCGVVVASVGLFAFLLPLPCVSGEDCGVVAAVVEDDLGQATIGPFDFPPFKLVTSNHFVVFIKIRGPVPIDYDRVRNWVPIFIINVKNINLSP